MVNHSQFKSTESDIEYNVLNYTNDNRKDKKYEEKFINKNSNSKIIIDCYTRHIEDDGKYHPYYNPGYPLSFTRWFKDGVLIDSHLQTIEEAKKYKYVKT